MKTLVLPKIASSASLLEWQNARSSEVSAILADADLAAEQTTARLRLSVLLLVGLALACLGSLTGVYSEWIAAIFGANLGISIVAAALARPATFRSWVPWLLTTLDAAVVLGVMMFGDFAGRMGAAYTPALAVSWVMFLLLALSAVRFKPVLVIYFGGLLVAGLAMAMALDAPQGASADAFGPALGLVFGPGHNVIRLLVLAATTLVLAFTVARGRRNLLEAILAARRSTNLSRYFPSGLVPLLGDADVAALERGRHQDVAILFADIRGFTALSENLDPAAIAEFLAAFRCRATRAIESHGGIIDKFVGDNVMGVFGVPNPTSVAAADALAAGLALQAEVAGWNEKRRDDGRRHVSVGIGIHYGQVFVGVIAAGDRLEFTVIGDTVNTAQRIEELTKTTDWPLLVSAELLAAAKTRHASRYCHRLAPQIVRGRKDPLHLFALVSEKGASKPADGRRKSTSSPSFGEPQSAVLSDADPSSNSRRHTLPSLFCPGHR